MVWVCPCHGDGESGSFVDQQLTDFPQPPRGSTRLDGFREASVAFLKGGYQLKGRVKEFNRREVSSRSIRGRSVRLSRVEEVVALVATCQTGYRVGKRMKKEGKRTEMKLEEKEENEE